MGVLVKGFGAVVLGACVASAVAQQRYSVSYSAPTGDGVAQGLPYDLTDQTGRQLQDRIPGADQWRANLGQGAAYEWVGWRNAEPAIEFRFAPATRIDRIRIGFARNESSRIYVPPVIILNWVFYNINPALVAPNSRGFITVLGRWETETLRLQLVDGNTQRWILVDEIEFYSVPEPASVLLLPAAALLVMRRRRVS
ncbi:MAG: PEP-CTERM sorting domain-containing protein [Chthonomonas sp.]|nr:PEP-CTERM sorting domain-containing protein [Chthonomonas sp.]